MERKPPSSKFLSQEDVEAALPSQTVQLLLEHNAHDESHPLFTELEELCIDGRSIEWKERARWVKFEEIVEEGSYRWSKPHVASLSLHALFELKNYLTNGSVILDMKAQTLEQLVDLLLKDSVNRKSVRLDCKDRIRSLLLKRHRHQHQMRKMPDPASKNQVNLFCVSSEKNHNEKITPNPEKKGNIKKNGSYVSLSGTDDENSHSKTDSYTDSSSNDKKLKPNLDFMRKIPSQAEASNILVGEVDFLDYPIAAFIRINPAETFDNFTEVPIPTRFVFVLLGPPKPVVSYREVGRAMATLMSDQIFREVAYKSSEKQHILAGVEEFLNVATVLPPCEWDPTIRIEPPAKVPSQETRLAPPDKELDSDEEEEQLALLREQTGLARTGTLFGGLRNDLKRKIPWYFSDFRDALHMKTFASFIFLYFACLSPIITFGGLLAEATGKNIGAMESLISGFICGVGYGLFSGQPLSILGSTGPVLVLETIVFDLCTKMGWDYMSFRFWIGTWIAVTLFILVAIDASAYVCYITRFTEENFAFLIGFIFIYKAVENVFSMKSKYPINPPGNDNCFCLSTDNSSLRMDNSSESVNWSVFNESKCLELNGILSEACFHSEAIPNVFLMSLVLFFGTYIISTVLKDFKDARFFPSKVRQFISDFAVIIAIVTMTLIDYQTQVPTPKLQVPHEIKPTIPDRGWLISPFKNEMYTVFLAIPPALLGTILIFMDQQITAVIVNRKENKFKKSCGYHLDLFVLGILIQICSIMGLPWFVAATVLSLNHVNSLKLESECAAPGEKPQFLGVLEQRVTNIMIFTLIGLSVFLTPMLKHIPMPVLFGVFLYMGVSSLSGLQVFDRILIIFMPNKYQPDLPFLRQVRTKRVHLFTAIQLLCLACLWAIHSINSISILFPLMLVVMVGVRKLLDYVFTQKELKALDDPMPKQSKRYRKGNAKGVIGKFGQFFLGPKLILDEKSNSALNK